MSTTIDPRIDVENIEHLDFNPRCEFILPLKKGQCPNTADWVCKEFRSCSCSELHNGGLFFACDDCVQIVGGMGGFACKTCKSVGTIEVLWRL